ncbi:hypothetical protein [Maledivibacter halophilus]|uniref:Uncharacterized protein n=1 Tax=Maledivibacter halophilus TaxID=36842 RepID=A0A1T5LUX5_9FIRM|nr:hypothetical protein [Maledivibacter halophilus]SKC79827.1 hypothetical protein SAMN02194393_03368 [Maledivibacter halophilus]
MDQVQKDNLWLYKSSLVFIKKLKRNSMINQEEYNTMVKKLYEIYDIGSAACPNTIKGI